MGGTISAALEDLNCKVSCISNWKKHKPHFGMALIEAREEFTYRKPVPKSKPNQQQRQSRSF